MNTDIFKNEKFGFVGRESKNVRVVEVYSACDIGLEMGKNLPVQVLLVFLKAGYKISSCFADVERATKTIYLDTKFTGNRAAYNVAAYSMAFWIFNVSWYFNLCG